MDTLDREIMEAESNASPEHYRSRASNEIERAITTSSGSSVSSDRDSIFRRNMSRISTQNDLERHPTALSRIATQRSQHVNTVGSSTRSDSRASRKPLPAFGGGKPYPPLLPAQEEYVVEFDGPNDPLHAQNWPVRKKILTSAMLAYTTVVSTFTSSIFSTATGTVAQKFHVGLEVGVLGTSFYVLGFAFGPTLWAPLSELKGRRLPIVLSVFGFSLFTIATATAKDIQTVLICRFFAGFFGSCPLAVVAAVFSDMFDNTTRGTAIAVFSMTVFTGPMLAPFIGGFIVTSYLGWRWTEYLPAIMGFAAFIIDILFLSESYPPVILIDKASELRRRTRNWGIHAKQEEIEIDLRELIGKNFTRPLRLLFTEPIIFFLSLYMSFIYGLVYLFFTAYPLVFQGVYNFTPGQSGLTFFGMVIGQLLATLTIILQVPWYNRKLAANNGIPIPEWRLPSMMVGGITFAGGIFWFGWTGFSSSIPWASPAVSGILTGFGLMSIFLQALNYIVDAYLMFAASAIAGNTFMRSLFGAAFPLFGRQMFNGMHIQWAATLLGCVAIVLAPIPFIFHFQGAKIRARSKIAPVFSAPADEPESSDANADDNDEAPQEKEEEHNEALANAPKKSSEASGPAEGV